ncbi:MAG: hypothetical protein HQL66_10240, partial [Magnetococcales bacterium]|nr:hypothetical protein [Magnetococcales bacterium]
MTITSAPATIADAATHPPALTDTAAIAISVTDLFGPTSRLAAEIPGYEVRAVQQRMAERVLDAVREGRVLMIE